MGRTQTQFLKLTPKQARIVAFIHAYDAREQGSPSLKEIGRHFGCRSLNTIRQHLRLIEKKGHIALKSGQARGIRLIRPSAARRTPASADAEDKRVPLVGQIAAGGPILAEHNIEARLALPDCFQPAERFFALRVEGDSMTGIGIFSGDVVIVEKCAEVADGVVAAVRIGERATLKRVRRMADHLVLQAENSAVADLVVSADAGDEVKVEGRLAGVLRCCLPGRQIF